MRNILVSLLSLSSIILSAQWEWSIRGGSSNLLHTGTSNQITHVETDQAGNVYFLAMIGGVGVECDDQSLTAYSEGGVSSTTDILLSSFTSSGQHRWSKVIGGREGDFGYGLRADSLGGIYVTGFVWNPYNNPIGVPNTALHFDTDTVLPRVPYDSNYYYIEDTLRQSMFLAKYDTSGALLWLEMPEPDTVSFDLSTWSEISTSIDLDISTNGGLFWLCHLQPGKFRWSTDSIITQSGVYVVEYNLTGQQIDITKLDMNASSGGHLTLLQGGITFFRRNHTTGEFIVAGTNKAISSNGYITIDGDTLLGDSYIASFTSNGQLQWLHESGGNDIINIEALEMDALGDLFITGIVYNGTSLAGYMFNSTKPHGSPFVLSLNSSGIVNWGQMAVCGAQSSGMDVELVQGEVAVVGYGGNMYWPSHPDTMNTVPNQGYDAFITRFDRTDGIVISMERSRTNFGGGAWGSAIAAGTQNTYYLGGNFDQIMYMGSDTLYKVGSERSFFLTKYSCSVPEPSYSISGNNDSSSVFLNYTGPIADSVQWFMGDGTQLWGNSIQHTYNQDSVYRVCMRAYYECTDVMICDSIHVGSIGVQEVESENFTFYPNPTAGRLTIENLPSSGTLHLYSLNGALLLREHVNTTTVELDLSSYSPGLYLLEYQTPDGRSTFRKVMRE